MGEVCINFIHLFYRLEVQFGLILLIAIIILIHQDQRS